MGDLVFVIRREYIWISRGNMNFFIFKYFIELCNSFVCCYIIFVSSYCWNVILEVLILFGFFLCIVVWLLEYLMKIKRFKICEYYL